MKGTEKWFYGRARRIELAKRIGGIAAIIIIIVISIYFISTRVSFFDKNEDYAYLIRYFENNGYSCQMIQRSGGSCSFTNEGTKYLFVRYDEGFNYIVKTDSYSLELKHYVDVDDSIVLKTNANAFASARNKYYYCTTDHGVVGTLKSCATEDGDKLTIEAYTGVVEKAIYDLNNIIKASGYDFESIVDGYAWIKK